MKTHTETIEVQIPDGYTCIGYQKPLKGELYLSDCRDGKIAEASFDFASDRCHVVEKTHKLPVALFVLGSGSALWKKLDVPNPKAWKFELLSTYRYTYEGVDYDLMILDTSATRCMVLGHYNDGPSS